MWVEEDSVAETAGAAMKEVERNREFKTAPHSGSSVVVAWLKELVTQCSVV